MAQAVAAVAAIAGAGYGMWSGEKARGAASKARRRQRALTQQAYTTNMRTWQRNKELSGKWSQHWQRVAENPGSMNPYFSTFKKEVGSAAEGTRGQIADALRRSGRTDSGQYEKALTDIGSASEKSLIKTLAAIQQDATTKQQQAEGSLGAEPYLGMQGSVPSMGDENFRVGDYAPQMPDFSGIGSALAYMGREKKAESGDWDGAGIGNLFDPLYDDEDYSDILNY